MAYLTYVIDHYDNLPSTIVFLHAHRDGFLLAWHNDAPLHDNVNAMRMLRTDFVEENGYVNLRCNWNPGCKEAHRFNIHVTEQVWWDVFEGTSTPPLNASSPYEQESPLHKYMRKPEQIGAACRRIDACLEARHQAIPDLTLDERDLTTAAAIDVADQAEPLLELRRVNGIHWSAMRPLDPDRFETPATSRFARHS